MQQARQGADPEGARRRSQNTTLAEDQVFVSGPVAKTPLSITPQRLVEELPYLNQGGQRYSSPLWQHMVYVVNDCSYHRGRITALPHQLRAEAASTDLRVYYDENPKKFRMARCIR
ncbi:MAG: hypothetical protein DMG39_00350 [Acidobacteria bacterium]|nr:MAG: hypothetical protein DMG39_00350 [Acidobacteriota bacterium]